MDLPEEIIYKILSYLPAATLTELNLSNKQYWNVYRMRTSSSKWESKINWGDKLLGTDRMILSGRLYIHSLYSLNFSDPHNFTHIPIKNKVLVFQKFLDGYLWHPLEKVDITKMRQILNPRDKSLTYFKVNGFCCGENLLEIFNKYILRHIWRNIPEEILEYCVDYPEDGQVSEDVKFDRLQPEKNDLENKSKRRDFNGRLLRLPNDEEFDVPLVLYLSEPSLDLTVDYLVFADEVKIDDYILWKVLKVCEDGAEVDIGRAVLSPKLHKMMNSDVGIALLGSENEAFGVGNFNYLKASEDVLKSIPKSVFDTYNFVIVKKTELIRV